MLMKRSKTLSIASSTLVIYEQILKTIVTIPVVANLNLSIFSSVVIRAKDFGSGGWWFSSKSSHKD